MCRSVCLLLLIFSVCRRGLSSSPSVTQTARPGENVTLHCGISSSTEMVWYRQIQDELTVIFTVTQGHLDKDLVEHYNRDPEHFQRSGQTSLSLIIVGIRQSDIGLYFCGARQGGVMNFTRAVRLQFTDAERFTSGSAQCWMPLVAVSGAFALMLMICLSVVYKRGLASSSCMKCVNDGDMKEAELQYASLKHNVTPRERDASHTDHNVVYDKVARKTNR